MAGDWLEVLRKKQQRVHDLRAELATLEAELRDAKAILAGRIDPIPSSQGPKPKSRHGFTGGKRAKPIQKGSSVWWTQIVLDAAEAPLHIDEILRQVNENSDEKVLKNTLVSNLSRYVKHGDTFTRPAPSTFGLTKWDEERQMKIDLARQEMGGLEPA